jgi:signal peptidase
MKTVRLIWNIVTWTIVILAVAIAVLLAGVRLVGINPYTVLSGSMEPEYHVGSIIYVVDVDPHELKVNDPVTYMLSDDIVVTHRIIEIVPAVDENGAPVINDRTGKQAIRFVTKGDANNSADGALLHENNVIGKPIFSIPALGYVADYIQNPPGTYIAIVMACLLLLATFLPDILFPDKKEEEEKAAQAVSAEQMNAAKQEIEELKSQLAANEQSAPPAEAPEAPEADAASDAAESADDGDNTAE